MASAGLSLSGPAIEMVKSTPEGAFIKGDADRNSKLSRRSALSSHTSTVCAAWSAELWITCTLESANVVTANANIIVSSASPVRKDFMVVRIN
jgi:hypothetical protein